MSNSRSTKLHVATFPWFAFGHITPYLHLSNNLAQRGDRVSFLLPKGAQAKVEHLNLYPNLIHFYPLLVPCVDRSTPWCWDCLRCSFSTSWTSLYCLWPNPRPSSNHSEWSQAWFHFLWLQPLDASLSTPNWVQGHILFGDNPSSTSNKGS